MSDHALRLEKRAEAWQALAKRLRAMPWVSDGEHRDRWAAARLADCAADRLLQQIGGDLIAFWSEPDNGVAS